MMDVYICPNEKELLQQLRLGNQSAFRELYNFYKFGLAKNLLRLLKSHELVEDVLQELFMNVWENRRNIDPDRSIKSYLFQIAANKSKNIFRKAFYENKVRIELLPNWTESYSPIDDQIHNENNNRILEALLSRLSNQQRAVYTLCKLEGRSYKEVSEQLNISETTVNTHIRNANKTLKELLRNHPEILWKAISLIILSSKF